MRSVELWVLAYLLNSVWQVPLVFVAAWITSRILRRSGPAMEHRLWVTALALEVLLPGCSIQPARLFRVVWQLASRFWTAGPAHNTTRVSVTSGPGYVHGLLTLSSAMLAGIAAAYGLTVTYFAARLLWRAGQTRAMGREAQFLPLNAISQRIWTHCSGFFAVHDAEVAFSRQLGGPVTIGARRRLVLLPLGWTANLPDDDLSAAIAHEFAHMCRRDFAKNLLYEAIALPVAYHPLLWRTFARLAESRELVCDAMAAEAIAGREQYARSLLRLASTIMQQTPAKTIHGIGILDARNFERRIMDLTVKHVEPRGARRLAIVSVCLAIGVTTCASAMALHVSVSSSKFGAAVLTGSQSSQAPLQIGGAVHPPVLIHAVDPEYTAAARKAKISGNVIVHLIVDKAGNTADVHVSRGLDKGLDQEAVNAVRQYRFKPATLNGKPVPVNLFIEVRFQVF